MIIKPEDAKWIGQILKEFPFVMWDRFSGNSIMTIYGWIDRKKDAYKDFVVLTFYLKARQVYFISTSSEEYSERIAEIVGEKEHSKCERVEDNFKIMNSVKLRGRDAND